MDFAVDARTAQLRDQLLQFMDDWVYPAEKPFEAELSALPDPWAWTRSEVLRELQQRARMQGLWNLFLPGVRGAGLTNVQYAPLAEIMGRSVGLAPAVFNCAAPDTGNMELLALAGTPEQQQRWLTPLLNGAIRSAFAMTEPEVASSDATNITTRIERDGDGFVINGRKWWTSGAMNPDAELLIVMGKTDPSAPRHCQQSQILVPRDTPGVSVRRGMEVFGYDDRHHGGHAEIDFVDVRVPIANLLGDEGSGFALAQARLGPGRVHHCMRVIGSAERALELMARRAATRTAFGRPLADQGVVRSWVAHARVRLEQARLLTLKAAWLMDTVGNRAAHGEIQAIKIAAPSAAEWVLDKAIQLHGAGGLSQDFPLAAAFAAARTLRLADGPDEVHLDSLGRHEIARLAGTAGT